MVVAHRDWKMTASSHRGSFLGIIRTRSNQDASNATKKNSIICTKLCSFLQCPVSTYLRTSLIGNNAWRKVTCPPPQPNLIPAVDGAVRLTPHAGRVLAPSVRAPLAPRPRVREALAAEPALGLLEHRVDPARRLCADGPGKFLHHLGRLAPHRALACPVELVARQASLCAASGVLRLIVKLLDQLVLAETDGLDVAAHGWVSICCYARR